MAEQKITDMPREQISDSTTFGFRPIPDPTVLTTNALSREVANLKELFHSADDNLKELLQAKIDANSARIEIINKNLDTRAPAIREEVERLHSLFDERFKGVQGQFNERDKRLEQLAEADKTAIGAALLAQKEAASAQNSSNMEAAAKSEASFTKQIDQMQMLVNAVAKATDEKIDDLKTRLTLSEGTRKGMGEGWGIIVAAGGLATGILIAVASYIR